MSPEECWRVQWSKRHSYRDKNGDISSNHVHSVNCHYFLNEIERHHKAISLYFWSDFVRTRQLSSSFQNSTKNKLFWSTLTLVQMEHDRKMRVVTLGCTRNEGIFQHFQFDLKSVLKTPNRPSRHNFLLNVLLFIIPGEILRSARR